MITATMDSDAGLLVLVGLTATDMVELASGPLFVNLAEQLAEHVHGGPPPAATQMWTHASELLIVFGQTEDDVVETLRTQCGISQVEKEGGTDAE